MIQVIFKHLLKLQKKRADTKEIASNEQQEIEVAFKSIAQEEERIVEAYRLTILSSAQLASEIEKLNARRIALESRKASVARNPEIAAGPEIRRSLKDYCKLATRQMQRFNEQERQQFLRLLVHEIIVEGEKIRIKGAIPVAKDGSDSQLGEAIPGIHSHSFKPSGIATTTAPSSARNTSRITSTKLYCRGHNSVGGFPFR